MTKTKADQVIDNLKSIGHITTLDGDATVVRVDGSGIPLAIDSPLFQGDIVETPSGSGIGFVLNDQTLIAMAENSRLAVDQFMFDPANQEGSIRISVSQGTFAIVSGDVAATDPEALKIETPVATVGISGAQLGLDFMEKGSLVTVIMKNLDGLVGEAYVRNTKGVMTLNDEHQGTTVSAAAMGSSYTVPLDELLRMFGSVLGFLPDIGQANDYGVSEEALEDLIAAAITEQGEDISEGDRSEEPDIGELTETDAADGEPEQTEPSEPIKVINGDYTGPSVKVEPIVAPPFSPEQIKTSVPILSKQVRRDDAPAREDTQEVSDDLVLDLNTEPLAFDEEDTTIEDMSIKGRLTATDADMDELTFSTLTQPAHGQVILDADGRYTYEPDENYSGTDTFIYKVTDEKGGEDTATVTLDITPVADKPQLAVSDTVAGTDALPGKDTITGTEDADTITGGGSSDTLYGMGGNDILYGDAGEAGLTTVELNINAALSDIDTSEALSVTVRGVPDDATLSAGTESDGVWTLEPDDLNDLTLTLAEGFTDDVRLRVEATATETATGDVATQSANLTVNYGGVDPGADKLYGGADADTIYGEEGKDRLYGEVGDDALHGGAGDDKLYGDSGDDVLVGGQGDDELSGGEDADAFVFQTDSGTDVIKDYAYGEPIRFKGNAFSESDIIVAQQGKDTVITFGSHDVEVVLDNVNLNQSSYTITSNPDDPFVEMVLEES